MANLKEILKRLPGGYDLDCFIHNPKAEWEHWKDYFHLKNRFKKEEYGAPPQGKLLVISLQGNFVSAAKTEMLLAKSAQLAGLKPFVLTRRWAWANRFYRSLGIDSFVYFEDFIKRAMREVNASEIKEKMRQIDTFEKLMEYTYKGVKVGKYICSSLIRKTHDGSVNMQDESIRKLICEYGIEASIHTVAANYIYDTYKPDAVLFLERGYTPYGEFFDIALERKLDVVQWCGSHRNNSLMLKRYSIHNQDQHPASLSHKTWDFLKKMKWGEKEAEEIKQELYQNYSSGQWFSEVGTHFHSKLIEAEEVKKRIGLDPAKKTSMIFPHLFWDATFFWGEDIFANYREWFVEAVKAACKNTRVNWVVKLHPANLVKLARDRFTGELIEKVSIRESIGELPPHIKLMEPNTKISTYSLFQIMDYCLTVRGTIGIEAAMFGIPVFTAGTGRYDGHGFTIDSGSKENYLQKIARIQEYDRLTDEQVELAQKFAYGTFLLRPFPLKSIQISYKKDAKATQQVEYLVHSIEELKKAEDVIAFGNWLKNAKDEDYLIL